MKAVTYPQLQDITGEPDEVIDELIIGLLRGRAAEDEEYDVPLAGLILVADVFLAMMLDTRMVLAMINHLRNDLMNYFEHIYRCAMEYEETREYRCRWLILQLLDGRYITSNDPIESRQPPYDLHEQQRIMEWSVPLNPPPTVSVAVNVGVLWLRTMPSCLDLDSLTEAFQAGRLAPPSQIVRRE